MKAKLVSATVITRVIVPDNASEETILESAKPRLLWNLINDYTDLVEEIKEDTESPYDPVYDKDKFPEQNKDF